MTQPPKRAPLCALLFARFVLEMYVHMKLKSEINGMFIHMISYCCNDHRITCTNNQTMCDTYVHIPHTYCRIQETVYTRTLVSAYHTAVKQTCGVWCVVHTELKYGIGQLARQTIRNACLEGDDVLVTLYHSSPLSDHELAYLCTRLLALSPKIKCRGSPINYSIEHNSCQI